MMGGSLSHEFMLLTPAGEDSIVLCSSCGYRANMEAAECITQNCTDAVPEPLTPVETPDIHTIEELCSFLEITAAGTCKAVVYQKNRDDSYVVLFLRGDLDVNETKLTNHLGEEVHPALIREDSAFRQALSAPADWTAALPCYSTVLWRRPQSCCGANREGFHYTGLCMQRDCPDALYHDFARPWKAASACLRKAYPDHIQGD